ncbi:MAG: sugar ABC transporter substrate-binding protein, partial [Microbacterium sp.]
LTLWDLVNPAADDVRGRDLAANIASFEKAHPDVTVEVNTLPWANIDPQLMQAANAGNSPDVVRLLAWDLPKHVAAGNVLPLDEYFDGDRDDWLLGWDTLTSDGKKWAIPYEYRSPALYYRTDFTGDVPPATWDEMVQQAKAAPERPGVVLGLSSASQASALAEVFVSYLWDAGGEVFAKDGTAAFASPEGVATFERLGGMVKDGIAPKEIVGYTYEEVFQSITAGASDFWLLGSHRYETAVTTAGLEGKLALAPLPGDSGSAPAHVFGWTLAMGKDSKNQDLAAELIQHLTSAEAQLNRVKATGELPTRASVYQDAWFTTDDAATARMLSDWFAESGRTPAYGEHWVELSQIWAEALQSMVLEGVSAKKAAQTAADAYDALL